MTPSFPITPRACLPRAVSAVQFVSGEAGRLAGFVLELITPPETLPVRIRWYPQFAALVLPTRSDDWSRTLQPLQASGSFFPRRGTTRGINLFGPFKAARSFFCTLRKLRQEARGVFTILFRPSPSVVFAHDEQHDRRSGQDVVKG